MADAEITTPTQSESQTPEKPAVGGKSVRAAKAASAPLPPDPRLEQLATLLQERLGALVKEPIMDRGMLTLYVEPADVLETCRQLKSHPDLDFNYLICLSSIDRKEHLEVAYNLRSLNLKHEFCLRTKLSRNDPRVPSVTSLWKAANWHEREAFDLMGIVFEGHPDLRRILLPEDWEGYPLRKDYEYFPADVPDHQGPPDHLLLQLEGSQ